jgi:streptomycin 6-kinase
VTSPDPGFVDRKIRQWSLVADGDSFRSYSSFLRPVLSDGTPAMLKVPVAEDERAAIPVLPWFAGEGAATVFRWDSEAQLIERLTDDVSLKQMAESGDDDAATDILCDVVAYLHRPRSEPAPDCFVPIELHFESLDRGASSNGPNAELFGDALSHLKSLLAASNDRCPLHGDVHHENVLHDAARGWVAIDPRGVVGPPAYDYANIINNPSNNIAAAKGRLASRAKLIADRSEIDIRAIVGWAFAHAALAATWSIGSGGSGNDSLVIARLARDTLANL